MRCNCSACTGYNETKSLDMGRDSSVGIATRYGLHVPEIESRLGARFSALVQTGPRAHPASYRMGIGSFPGVKRPGRGVDHPPHLASRLKKWYSHTSTLPLGFHGLFSGEPSHAVFNSVARFTGLWNLPSPTSKEAQFLRRIRGPRRREVTED